MYILTTESFLWALWNFVAWFCGVYPPCSLVSENLECLPVSWFFHSVLYFITSTVPIGTSGKFLWKVWILAQLPLLENSSTQTTQTNFFYSMISTTMKEIWYIQSYILFLYFTTTVKSIRKIWQTNYITCSRSHSLTLLEGKLQSIWSET